MFSLLRHSVSVVSVSPNNRVSQIVTEIREGTGVIVDRRPDGNVKYAIAHDLRRSFGLSDNSQALMVLMRHELIATTMKYYVG